MSKNRDGIRDISPEAKATEAVLAPPPAQPEMTDRQLLNALAQHQLQLSSAVAGIVGRQDAFIKQAQEEEERSVICKREAEKPAEQRTQERADKRWPKRPEDTRWRIALLTAKRRPNPVTGRMEMQLFPDAAFPIVEIWAGSKEEADARYRQICGILSTESTIRVLPANDETTEPAADPDVPTPHWPAGVVEVP